MKISSNPVDALLSPRLSLVTGVEPLPRVDGAGVRVYVGPRWKGIHVHVDDADQAAAVERAWLGALGHLFATDIGPDTLCDCEAGS
jgi:hypothetical protein